MHSWEPTECLGIQILTIKLLLVISMDTLYRVYKKNATSEFPKKSTLFWRQKILGVWEFKIAQLSKLLHTRVHKATFMHLFKAQQQ
jgi:hypothetical protein